MTWLRDALTVSAAGSTRLAMPATHTLTKSIYLLGGSDEFSIKEAAAKLAEKLAPKGAGEFGIEIIDGAAANQNEALKIFGRLHEAINTVGFFSTAKLVWLKNTNLLADDKAVSADAVKEALAEFSDQLKRGLPDGVMLLISAVGLDRRRTAYKTLEKVAAVQVFDAPDESKQAGKNEIAEFIQRKLRAENKTMSGEAFEAFRTLVAPDLREIANELEKLSIYVGKRKEISETDVRAICSVSRESIIWDLTDSLGARRLSKAIAALENLLVLGEKPVGIVMMLAGQFRLTLLAKDLMLRKVLIPTEGYDPAKDYANAFQQLPERATAHFPLSKEGKPPNAWRLYRCAVAAKNFSIEELVGAMDLLLEANRQLVSTQLDARLVLEEAIVRIARRADATGPARR
jgi:DNA polymerase-3 subunit delta